MSLMSTGKPAKSLSIEPKLDGKIVELTADDEEMLWGTIKTYDPNDALSLNFHMGLPPENASLVEFIGNVTGDPRSDCRGCDHLRIVRERTGMQYLHANLDVCGCFMDRICHHAMFCRFLICRHHCAAHGGFRIRRDTTGDDHSDIIGGTFGKISGHSLEPAFGFFETGMHRSHY
jgi:hypothetical protein